MKSYFVNFRDGEGKYFRRLRDARTAFNTEQEDGTMPTSLEVHKLTNDCFERAYNGGGGFVEDVEVIENRA